MQATPPPSPGSEAAEPKLKIYFLPNLLTAGNLFCGFVALTKIVEADVERGDFQHDIAVALGFILLACIFDLFDGRVAILTPTKNTRAEDFDTLERFWSSLGSVVVAVEYPLVSLWLYWGQWPLVAISVATGALVVWRHRSNIGRIARGEEPHISLERVRAERARGDS